MKLPRLYFMVTVLCGAVVFASFIATMHASDGVVAAAVVSVEAAQAKTATRVFTEDGYLFEGMAGAYPKELGILCRIFKKINEALRQGKSYQGVFKNRVLLYGQTGNGKTMVTDKIIEESGSKLFYIGNIYSVEEGYAGNEGDVIRKKFKDAVAWTQDHRQTAVIMIDMMELGMTKASSIALQEELDNIQDNKQVMFIANTNDIARIRPGLLERLECIEIPMPNEAIRREFIRFCMKKFSPENPLPEYLENVVVRMTSGMNMSGLEHIIENALMYAESDGGIVNRWHLEKGIKNERDKWKDITSSADSDDSLFESRLKIRVKPYKPKS